MVACEESLEFDTAEIVLAAVLLLLSSFFRGLKAIYQVDEDVFKVPFIVSSVSTISFCALHGPSIRLARSLIAS